MKADALKEKAAVVRRHIIEMLTEAGSGHPGGSLSSVEILVSLYFSHMRHDPARPQWDERDLFVLSKGHGCPALYAVLAEAGYFDMAELATLRKLGSRLQGHPANDRGLPGIEIASGSLGQGLSITVGAALGMRIRGQKRRAFCLMSDGEQQEGSVWEAAMAAGHFKLDNLCAIIDCNNLQIDGRVEDIMGVNPLADKYTAFRWQVIECDGHSSDDLQHAFRQADAATGAPTMILARTVKGKGVSFMENMVDWHGKSPSREQAQQALDGLR